MHTIKFEITDQMAADLNGFLIDGQIKDQRELFANMVALWRWADQRSREGKAIVALNQRTNRYNEITLPSLDWLKALALADRELGEEQPPQPE